jgi:hypothetical protein
VGFSRKLKAQDISPGGPILIGVMPQHFSFADDAGRTELVPSETKKPQQVPRLFGLKWG